MKYNVEDLLKLVEENKQDFKKPRYNVNDVHQFIQDLDIREGNNRVAKPLVYKAYKLWGGKKTALSFSRVFGRYFEPLRSGHAFYHYKINVRAVELLNKVDNGLVKF